MKHYFIIFIFTFTICSYGQENFLKTYRIKAKTSRARVLKTAIKNTDTVYYKNLDFKEKEKWKNEFKIKFLRKDTISVSAIHYYEEVKVGDKIMGVLVKDTLNKNHKNYFKIKTETKHTVIHSIKSNIPGRKNRKGFQGYIKLDKKKNKIIVVLDKCQNISNLIRELKWFEKKQECLKWLLKGCHPVTIFEENGEKLEEYKNNKKTEFYYDIPLQTTIRLSHKEWSVSTLIIPIKYRFAQPGLEPSFSSSINANFFVGGSWGKTSFYNNGVDYKSNTWKFSVGLIGGISTITLTESNTRNGTFTDGKSSTEGLLSTGVGITYSFNKINFGVFYGYDYGVGENVSKWNFNKKPWAGLAVGYSIFNF